MNVRKSHILIIVIVVIGFITNACDHSTVHRDIRDSISANANAPDAYPKLLAVYVPWFGDKDHINVGYSTQDPSVLRSQINKARELGIYGFAINWYGNRHPFLDHSTALLAKIAADMHYHVCLMYDEIQEDNGHSTDDALEEFDRAYKDYIAPDAPGHDAYVFYNGRPVIFIFPKYGHTDWDQVRAMVDKWPTPPLLIYKDHPPAKYVNDFDGIYAWVHPGKGWAQNGSDWGKEYLQNFYKQTRAKYPDKLVIGAAWPGFDDSKASWGLNRHMDQRCGKTFEDTLSMYHEYADASKPMPFLVVATWNDYEEGTAIERGLAKCEKGSGDQSRGGGQ
ncbi:MAG TPA: hypothetical protein VFA89_09505 [Terriglobales bacterium]|nr:hypothetical protein [Terriglobales bacterium]